MPVFDAVVQVIAPDWKTARALLREKLEEEDDSPRVSKIILHDEGCDVEARISRQVELEQIVKEAGLDD